MILISLKDTKYAQLDYFAILPEYQDKGYGTEAIQLLREKYCHFDFIFVEIEILSLGKNEEENKQRLRRDRFYKKANFLPLNYEFELYKVKYTPYVLLINTILSDEEEIVKKMFELYYKTIGHKYSKYRCLEENL